MTASKIVEIAKNELGVKESPKNSNKVKYNTWYYGKEVSGSAYPWCMTYVQWVFYKAGFSLPVKTASCTYLMNYAKNNGRWVTKNYQPGDILLYDFDGVTADADHTGICESATSSKVVAYEGNTSESGSQSNGGEVCRKTRNISLVLGAYRPEYEDDETDIHRYDLSVDGEIGKNTVKALQDFLGTPVDGWIDGQYSQYKPYWTSIISQSCNWSGGTSEVVTALQKFVNVKADGMLGSNTARALQKYLISKGFSCGNTGADGYFGTDSAKALQRFLNAI